MKFNIKESDIWIDTYNEKESPIIKGIIIKVPEKDIELARKLRKFIAERCKEYEKE